MAQFDIHHNANPASRAVYPYLLDVQAPVLSRLATRVVVPLIVKAQLPKPARTLNPELIVNGVEVVMLTQEIAGVPLSALGEVVQSAQARRQDILAALDLLVTGA